MFRSACAAGLAVLLVAGCVTGRASRSRAALVTFENATPEAPLRIRAEELRPAGSGPFPAVVLMHGCHGVSDSLRAWARWLRDHGYVALLVDSWAPRRIRDACAPAPEELPNTARFDDAVGALRWLGTRRYVDARRVGVIGWSNGGVFAMALVNGPSLARARARGVTLPGDGFRAAVGVYPGGCFSLIHERVVRPLLVLIGGDDDWTIASECVRMVEAMRARGADATVVVYPGAVHYFDVEGLPRTYLPEVENRNRPGNCCGASVGYDAAAAADAHRRIEAFLADHVAGGESR